MKTAQIQTHLKPQKKKNILNQMAMEELIKKDSMPTQISKISDQTIPNASISPINLEQKALILHHSEIRLANIDLDKETHHRFINTKRAESRKDDNKLK